MISGASAPTMWQPKHAIAVAIDDELHHGALLAPGEGVLHRPEARAIDVDAMVLRAPRARSGRRVPTGGWLNTAVGDVGVIDLDRIVVEQRLGDGAALGDRDRREVEPVGHVADAHRCAARTVR